MKVPERDYRKVVGVRREKMAGLVQAQNEEKRTEKQIGCMSGFLQIFDRQQILAGKRIHSTKRLPPSTGVGASPETVSSGEFSRELKPEPRKHVAVNSQSSPAENVNCRSKSPAFDGDENQRRSLSVIARLMGLEPLSYSNQKTPQTVAKPTLRRSATEPRVSRDLIHSKYIDDNNFQLKQPTKSQNANGRVCKSTEYASVNLKSECSRTSSWRSRSFFDSTDFFPEPNQTTVHEQSSDLSTLKQILEVLQLKGLLRSSSHRNFVYDRNLHSDESNILLVKPRRSSATDVDHQRSGTDSRRTRRYVRENSPAVSLKRDGGAVDRSGRIPARSRTSSPNRIESNLKSCNPTSKRTDSSKLTPNRNGSVHHSSINRSPRSQKSTESSSSNSSKQKLNRNAVTDDESSSISESIISPPSPTDSERCDKLHNRRAETSSSTESPPSSATVLPSPVSVLDSRFDTDEPSTPSDCIDLKVVDYNDENGSPDLSPEKSTEHEELTSVDSDFIYISEIVRASKYLQEDPNVFFSIEKQLYNTENTSNVSKRQRKLIFNVVLEIIGRNIQLPPWKASFEDSRALLKQIWSEFKKIREINTGDGILEVVSGVIEKDFVAINDWRDYPIEASEAILDIERMIFKDLVSEAIHDLAEFSGECVFLKSRRKLVF